MGRIAGKSYSSRSGQCVGEIESFWSPPLENPPKPPFFKGGMSGNFQKKHPHEYAKSRFFRVSRTFNPFQVCHNLLLSPLGAWGEGTDVRNGGMGKIRWSVPQARGAVKVKRFPKIAIVFDSLDLADRFKMLRRSSNSSVGGRSYCGPEDLQKKPTAPIPSA